MHLILASSSPRRKELLRNAGFDFESRASNVQEILQPGESAEQFVCRAARDKARAVAASAPPDSVVLGADTVVAIDGYTLCKPNDAETAARMLRLLAGRTHRVITGVCVIYDPDRLEAARQEITRVTFAPLDDQEIREYVQTGEPMDKAGGYGIQGLASKFVIRIEGCYFNVVGLPMALVYEMLKPLLKRHYIRQ
jgi:septum formation protein